MPPDQETEMSDAEIDEFLGRHETGVLALASANEPYAIPISYGYDATERAIYVRLVSTPESEKRAFLASSPWGRIVVYEADGAAYRSVVVYGSLEKIPPAELTPDDVVQYGRTKRPLFEIWAADKHDLDIELYRLNPESLTGRAVEIDRET